MCNCGSNITYKSVVVEMVNTDVLQKIVDVLFEVYDDDYEKVNNAITTVDITYIIQLTDMIIISCRRPGILIGLRGKTLNAIKRRLGDVRIHEDNTQSITNALLICSLQKKDEIYCKNIG